MSRIAARQGLRRRKLHALAAATLLCVNGCATTEAPVEQVKFFSQAFTAVNTVGQPLLDDLAIAERKVGKGAAANRAQKPASNEPCSSNDATWTQSSDPKVGFIDGFCLEDATYFASLGDPLATAQLRGGLRVIERYAEVLTALAEGRNLEQALGQVDALGQEVSGLIALTGANVVLVPALTALRPLLANVATQANAEEARRLILEGTPMIAQLITALRTAVPEMFKILIVGPRRAMRDAATAPAAVQAVNVHRVAVSDYVVLLSLLQAAWDATAAAARTPGGVHLAALVARTAQVRADAEAVRRSLAVLRSVDPTP